MRPSNALFTLRAISRLASSLFVVFLASGVFLPNGVRGGDQSRDAIRPSGDRFPAFALNVLRPAMGSVPVGFGPRRGQLRVDKLTAKLGSDFDAEFMSVNRPPEGTFPTKEVVRDTPDDDLQQELAQLNFTYLDDVTGVEQPMKPALKRYMERWLLQRAACPIRQAWVDLGLFFWPRWVRKGSCDARASCSWPSGMHCVPQDRRPLRLLRWTCTQPRRRAPAAPPGAAGEEDLDPEGVRSLAAVGGGTGLNHLNRRREAHCRWRKVRYSITSECYCSC